MKMNKPCLPGGALKELTRLSLFVSEIANITPLNSRPFVGRSAFAHKGGVHVHAVLKNPEAYEHIRPELTGNHRRVLVSDLSGKSNIEYKAAELGLSLGSDDTKSRRIVEEIKHMENEGYTFEAADGSLALIIRKATGEFEEPFYLECFRVINEKQGNEPSARRPSSRSSWAGTRRSPPPRETATPAFASSLVAQRSPRSTPRYSGRRLPCI